MPSMISYLRGKLEDLSNLKFASTLSVNSATVEFNVVGMVHEFWIAVQDMTVVALMVLTIPTSIQRTILYLHASNNHKKLGIGSVSVLSTSGNLPESELSVIPYEGTEIY